MKKLLALLFVACFVVVTAVGCGGETTKKSPPPGTGGTGKG